MQREEGKVKVGNAGQRLQIGSGLTAHLGAPVKILEGPPFHNHIIT